MASVFERNGTWYVRYKDSTGRWVQRASKHETKTGARKLAREIEQKEERIRLGLEAAPPKDGGGTLGELLGWWLEWCDKAAPSHRRNVYTVRRHIIGADLAKLPLVQVTAPRVEAFLDSKASEGLAPGSVNGLRGFLSRAFQSARRVGRYTGQNPVLDVQKRRVPRRVPDYLRAPEATALMAALAPEWRALFATALYTGMRKGEILGLRKSDVDLTTKLITIARSHGRDTTKGGHADVIPIADALVPFLRSAIDGSPSDLVFPGADGRRMNEQVRLHDVLRRALGRAGVVEGYEHRCRARVNAEGRRDPHAPRCGHIELAPDRAIRRCPIHGDVLWPVAKVRPVRFHDLRHTTASLLMMAGVNPAAVQRILRHSDPKITTEVYGHLAPGYLRSEVERLPLRLDTVVPEIEPVRAAAGASVAPFAATLLHDGEPRNSEAGTPSLSRGIPAGFHLESVP